jgi:hypothetical protein
MVERSYAERADGAEMPAFDPEKQSDADRAAEERSAGALDQRSPISEELHKALKDLVDACAYVKPFAGEILSEGENVTVKNMQNAMKFCAAIERAQKLLGED